MTSPSTSREGGRPPRYVIPDTGWWRIAGWWLVKPLLGLLTLPVFLLVDGFSVVGLVAVLAAVPIRPVRRAWPAVLPTLMVAPLAPVAAVVFAARGLLAIAILYGPAGGLARGADRVKALRAGLLARLLELLDENPWIWPIEVTGSTRQALDFVDLTFSEPAIGMYLATAWAEARPIEQLRAGQIMLESSLVGTLTETDVHDEVFRAEGASYLVAYGAQVLLAVAIVAGAAVWALATGYRTTGLAFTTDTFLAGLAGWWVLPLLTFFVIETLFLHPPERLIVWRVAVALLIAPLPMFLVTATALAASMLFRLAEPSLTRLWVNRSRVKRYLSPEVGGPRFRNRWRIAERAAEAGQEQVASDLFLELAASSQSRPKLVRAATARAVLNELDRGRVGVAGDLLDRLEPDPEEEQIMVLAIEGIVRLELGEEETAERLLSEVAFRIPRRSALYLRVLAAQTEALTANGQPERAIGIQNRLRMRGLGARDHAEIFASEVAVATALSAKRDFTAALDRLRELREYADLTPGMGGTDFRDEQRIRTRAALTSARGHLLSGRIHLLHGQAGSAEPEFRRALGLLASAPPSYARTHIRSAARILHGYSLTGLGEFRQGAAEIDAGITDLEARRTQLRSGDRRTALIVAKAELYRRAFEGLVKAREAGVDSASMTGARLIESLRQSAIADTLRSGDLPFDEHSKALIKQLENMGEGAGEDPSGRPDRGRAAEQQVIETRFELEREISRAFASAYLPRPVSPGLISRTARKHGHILSFHVPDAGFPAWRSWVSPEGEVEIDRILTVNSPARQRLEQWIQGADSDPLGMLTPLYRTADGWEELARELLPPGLFGMLADRPAEAEPVPVLLVPDGPLSTFPWAALHVAGSPVITRARLSLTPSIELLRDRSVPESEEGRPRVAVHFDHTLSGTEFEQRQLEAAGRVESAATREDLVSTLDAGNLAGVYLAAHGEGMGLAQKVGFSDGSSLSAATALVHPWPAWVVFASCLVGRIEHQAGREPFGLAVSCLLGGAETFISSVVEISSASAADICGRMAAELLARATLPAETLRQHQLRYLESDAGVLASASDCLGLVAISAAP